jgi:hypothetical protein
MIADWFVAIGTIIIAIVAVFQDVIRNYFWRPELDVEFSMTHPDCHKTILTSGFPNNPIKMETYYFRLKIWNRGNKTAENVEVFAIKLEREQVTGRFEEDTDFVPSNFCWTYYEVNKPIKPFFIPLISPETYKYCTLAKVIDPEKRMMSKVENTNWKGVPEKNTILSFETTFPTASLSFLHPPGKYRLYMVVAAANAKPIEKVVEIDLKGEWYDDRQEMYNKGISIKIK